MLDQQQIHDVLVRVLGEHVPDAVIEETPENGGADFVASYPSGSLVGQIKQAKSASIESVIGLLASSVLQSQRIADRNDLTIPLVMAIVPRVGTKTKREVERFMLENAPDCGWSLTDATGATRIVIPQLDIDVDERGLLLNHSRWHSQGPTRLFSDLNRWILKVLLLPDAPRQLWNGPREGVATPTELHRVADVSVAKAHQFCRAFEKAGFLYRSQQGLAIVRKRTLMETWFYNERARRTEPLPVRSIFGRPTNLQEVFCRHGMPSDFAICGFEACRLLGVMHAPMSRLEVYLEGDIPTAMETLEIEPCDERDAHFHIRKAPFPQSVLRGRQVRDNLPVVDVLQAALDVCDQAARGAEQSEYIVSHVLGWIED